MPPQAGPSPTPLSNPLVRFFARETSSTSFIPTVDGLRFIAIASVLLYHAAVYVGGKLYAVPEGAHLAPGPCESPLFRFSSLGFFGVQLFFAISGFILAVPFARAQLEPSGRRVSLRAYFLRRVTRLEPPYIFNLLFFAALLIAVKHQPVVETLKHLLASIFYCHYYVYHDASTINGVAWSLEVEVQFYILAPILSLVFAVRNRLARRAVIAGAIVASCLAQGLFSPPPALWHGFGIWNQMHFFLIGFLLADFYLTDWRARPTSALGDIVGVAGWAALAASLYFLVLPGSHSHGPQVHLAASASVLLAYAGAFRGWALSRVFSQPFLFLIGGMCYTIYLWHYLVIVAVGTVLIKLGVKTGNPGVDAAIYFAAAFPAVVAVCAVLFVLIEKPCMKKDWPARLAARLRGRPLPAD